MSADVEALLIAARNSGGNWTADMIDQAQALIRQDDLADEIEIAARRLDVWAEAGPMSCRGAWYMFERAGKYSVEKIGPIGTSDLDGWEKWDAANTGARDVPAPTAALFLLLLGLPEVAVTCPDCLARGAGGKLARWEWCQRVALTMGVPGMIWCLPSGESERGPSTLVTAEETLDLATRNLHRDGWLTEVSGSSDLGYSVKASRPCPACSVDGLPTGKVKREPARLLLDAMPTRIDEQERMAFYGHDMSTFGKARHDAPTHWPGDPVARERLDVLADELQASGNPRGEWLALWLRGAVVTEAGHTMPIDTALPAITAELSLFCGRHLSQ